MVHYAVGRGIPAEFFSSESALDELQHRLGAQRVQVGLQRGRTFPPVVGSFVGRDVPEVAGWVFDVRATLSIFLIGRLGHGTGSGFQGASVRCIAIGNV